MLTLRLPLTDHAGLGEAAPIIQITIDEHAPELLAIIDTGASGSHMPYTWASTLCHDNNHPKVRKIKTDGVGGLVDSAVHTLQIHALDEDLKRMWSHRPKHEFLFTKGFAEKWQIVIIGRVIIREWRSFRIHREEGSTRKKQFVEIIF